MSWLSNYVRPKLRQLVTRDDVPDNLWHQCPSCQAMLFHRDLEANLHCCSSCGHHFRLTPEKRLDLMFDNGDWSTIELPDVPLDPLKFRDRRRYTERLKEAQARSSRKDALIVAHGRVGGVATVAAVLDFSFLGGSMGLAVGEAFVAAARLAILQRAALIAVPASGGARMQEGILSLMQMPRTVVAIQEVREAGLPYLVLLTDPTTGGVSASFAMLGDIQIAEAGAAIGFAGQRVIRETIRESLPEGFQRAEYLRDHGMLDIVVDRADLKPTLMRVLGLLMRPREDVPVVDAPRPDLDIPAPPQPTAPDAAPAVDAAPADATPSPADAEPPRPPSS